MVNTYETGRTVLKANELLWKCFTELYYFTKFYQCIYETFHELKPIFL